METFQKLYLKHSDLCESSLYVLNRTSKWCENNKYDGWVLNNNAGQGNWDFRHFVKGVLHKEDGPALVTSSLIGYYQNGMRHRIDAPAILKKDGSWSYFVEGHCTRLNGPSIYRGSLYSGLTNIERYSWQVDDKLVTLQVIEWALQNNINPLKMSEDEKLLFTIFMSGFQ